MGSTFDYDSMMDALIDFSADFLIGFGLRLLLAIELGRKRLKKRLRKFRGSLRAVLRRWLWMRQLPIEGFRRRRGAVPHNRTPAHIEAEVVRLRIEQPQLGAGQLARLVQRVLGVRLVRETIRRILLRKKDLAAVLKAERRRKPRRITVTRPLQLWGIDHTLVMVLGFFPVWLLGVVDYKGSRLILLQRCRPTAAAVTSALQLAFDRFGKPDRILSDNGPAYRSLELALFLADHGVDHRFTLPAHPWTNGRIERLFRTFKDTVFRYIWLFASLRQIDRYCADFMAFYNRDRPHSAYDGRTPNEVFFGLKRTARPQTRVSYFDGQLHWYRFG